MSIIHSKQKKRKLRKKNCRIQNFRFRFNFNSEKISLCDWKSIEWKIKKWFIKLHDKRKKIWRINMKIRKNNAEKHFENDQKISNSKKMLEFFWLFKTQVAFIINIHTGASHQQITLFIDSQFHIEHFRFRNSHFSFFYKYCSYNF